MIPALAGFVAEMRRDGFPVSQAEALDAVRAVTAVGLEQRGTLRAALGACLLKHHAGRERFERLFRRHFAAPELSGRKGRGKAPAAGATGGERGRTESEDPARSRSALRGSRGESGRSTMPPAAPARPRAERPRRDGARRLRLQRIVAANREAASSSRGDRDDPLHRPLDQPFTPAEERLLADAVPRYVERIRLSSGRRSRRSPRGRLNLRSLFRENAAHGGVPWVLPRRRRRPRRRRVVVLVDVSWSAARAAGLFLSLASAFVERSARTRVILFVDRPVEATPAVERWLAARPGAESRAPGRPDGSPGRGLLRAGVSFVELLENLPDLSLTAPSDYGRVFDSLPRVLPGFRGRDTVLLILGDGRTNRFDPQSWRFEELAAGCGAVLWLVPEPRSRWGTADSALSHYLQNVDVAVEAHDLEGLARGVGEWVRRL